MLYLYTALVSALIAVIISSEFSKLDYRDDPSRAPAHFRENVGFAVFTLLTCSVAIGALTLLTQHLALSIGCALVFCSTIFIASKTKFSFLKTRLLFSDVYFHLREKAEIKFFLAHFGKVAAVTFALLVLAVLLIFAICWGDVARIPQQQVGLFLLVITPAWLYAVRRVAPPDVRNDIFRRAALDERHISGFLISAYTFPSLIKREFTLPHTGECFPQSLGERRTSSFETETRPNVIVILHESSVDPTIYFRGANYEVSPKFFSSGDGKTRRLTVKTWGGGTWISEYGFLLGVDTSYFGDLSGFLGVIGVNRFQNTVPQEFGRLGYLCVANYPSPSSFLNTDRFYKSIGFDRVNTPDDMGLHISPLGRPRDRDYYEYLIRDFRGRRLAHESRPLFYFVWTTANHQPYTSPMFLDVRASEIKIDDIAAEYSRRQRISADDLAWFEDQLKKFFPDEEFIVAGFGDHHPIITEDYFRDERRPNIADRVEGETMYQTYFRMKGINFAPSYKGLPDGLDISFLGEAILEAARLPASPAVNARRWLRRQTGGVWASASAENYNAVSWTNYILSHGETSVFTNET
jgi:phosphoglycerol transferase MdoB-like AlkP superfamily enzyme